ncbi:MAG: lipopolysaccharide biosynthesis protein [Bacteroidales bacterium]|nr:lipopolysaccharide biosynthesis protein [Bacteroidales bacterium]
MGIIAKQSFWGTVVTYLGTFVGFLTTFFVLTRFLTAEEIGLARVLIDTSVLFIGLAQLGTSSSLIRFYPYFKDKEEKDHGFFFWMLAVPFAGFILFAIIYCALHVPISHLFEEKSQLFVDYYYFVLPLAFFLLYQTVVETGCNVLMRIVFPKAVRELITRLLMLTVYLLYAFRVLSMDGFVIALCAVYGIAALLNIVYIFAVGKISIRPDLRYLDKSLVKQYLWYTFFLIFSAITTVLAPSLSSFFITAQLGLNYTGIFAIATYMAVMVSIPTRSLSAIAQPQLASAIKEKNTKESNHLQQQVGNNLLLVGLLILAAIWINIDLIFEILPNGETYASAKQSVLILGCSQLIVSTCTIATSALSYSPYYYLSLVFSAILTVVSIWLNNLLIPLYGMEGAAAANLAAYGIYYALLVSVLKACTKTSPISRNWLKSLALGVWLFGGNSLLLRFVPIGNIWGSSIVRSVVLLGIGCLIAYYWNISPDLNQAVRQTAERILKRKR